MADFPMGDDRPGGVTVASAPAESALELRVRAAALSCVARGGVRGTTLDDVAAEAGCSRASVYRAFPGGRDVLLHAVLVAEIERVQRELADALSSADSLDEVLALAIGSAAATLSSHPAFLRLMADEPGIVLPHLSFQGMNPVLARSVSFLAPFLARFTDDRTARETAEWAARLVLLFLPDPESPFDLTDPADVRRLVGTYLIPGLPPSRLETH